MDPNSDDAAIAEFHADARRKRRRIMAITALLCVAIGAVILVVSFTAGGEVEGGRFESRTILVGGGFVVAGFAAGGMALKGE